MFTVILILILILTAEHSNSTYVRDVAMSEKHMFINSDTLIMMSCHIVHSTVHQITHHHDTTNDTHEYHKLDHGDSRKAVLVLPRILEMCNRYKLSESEREMFHLMVVVQGSSDSHVLVRPSYAQYVIILYNTIQYDIVQ